MSQYCCRGSRQVHGQARRRACKGALTLIDLNPLQFSRWNDARGAAVRSGNRSMPRQAGAAGTGAAAPFNQQESDHERKSA